MPKPRIPASVRFWSKVRRTDNCWIWTAKISPFGYGRFWDETQRETAAHKFAYIDTYGPIPEGLLVCHKCDVRHCVRPDHLFLGTQKDNIQDAIKKNRFPQMFSLKRGGGRKPVLSKEDLHEIRSLYSSGVHSQQAIANMFNVSQNCISKITLRDPRYPYYQ